MNLFQDFRNNFRKKYFKKNLMIYTAISFLAILSIFFGLTQAANKTLYNSIYKSNKILLDQVKSMSDSLIVNQTNLIVNQNFVNIALDLDYLHFLNLKASENYDLTTMRRIYTKLSNINSSYDFVDSIALYNSEANVIVSSTAGVMFADKWQQSSLYSVATSKIQEFLSANRTTGWFAPEEQIVVVGEDENVITFVQAISPNPIAANKKGCVMISINIKKMVDYIGSISDKGDNQFLIMNQAGKVFAHSNPESIKEDYSWLLPITSGAESGYESISYYHDQLGVAWAASDANDWIYVSVIPIKKLLKDLNKTYRTALVLTIIILLMTMLSIHYATVYLYKPIREILNDTLRKFQANTNDEFGAINAVINSLSDRAADAEMILDENKNLIKNQFVQDILSGNLSDEEELKARFTLMNIDYDYLYSSLVFIEFDNEIIAQLPVKEREALFYKAIDLFTEYFSDIGLCLCVKHNQYIVAILSTNMPEYIEALYSFHPTLSSLLQVDTNFAFCEPVHSLSEIHAQFKNLTVFMQYSFIYGFGTVFSYEFIDSLESFDDELPESFMTNMSAALQSGDTNDARECLGKIISEIRAKRYSYAYTQSILLQIISSFCRAVKRFEIPQEEISKAAIIADFSKATTLDEFAAWLVNLLKIYFDKLEVRNMAIDRQFIENIAEYIGSNINHNLSLKSVADRFNISPNYLSKIFKEGLGINFSTYINAKKFDCAAQLLRENHNMKIKDVAEQVGYYNLPYFTQQFKEKFGMTPNQYRKSSMNRPQ